LTLHTEIRGRHEKAAVVGERGRLRDSAEDAKIGTVPPNGSRCADLPVAKVFAREDQVTGTRLPPGENIDDLFPELYAELRRIARVHRSRHGRSDTLSTTALVNEAYLRLKQSDRIAPKDRLHFLALSARAMRFVLIDYARRSCAGKRGRQLADHAVDVETVRDAATLNAESTLALHTALEHLSERHARMAQVVECRFFGGMTEDEIAALLGVSERTVRGDWQRAKLWLADDLGAD
jgi:RNA polymerase sigma factor (TIGR02999 family)